MSWLAVPRVWAVRDLVERNEGMQQTYGAITVTQLYEEHYDTIFRYISRRLPRREEAEDVTEEVFATAFGALSRFRGRCEPRLWILTIARRKVIDWQRKHARRREILASELYVKEERTPFDDLPLAEEHSPAARFEQSERRRVLRNIIEGLKEEQREALLLSYADGFSQAEIAVVMERSVAAVNSLLQRARAAIYREGRDYFVLEPLEKEAAQHGTV